MGKEAAETVETPTHVTVVDIEDPDDPPANPGPECYLHVAVKVNLAALLAAEGVGEYLAEYFRDAPEVEAANLEVRSVGVAILE